MLMCGPAAPTCAAIAAVATTAFVAGVTSGSLSQALKAGAIAGATAVAVSAQARDRLSHEKWEQSAFVPPGD